MSPTTSQHLLEVSASLEMRTRRLSSVDSLTIIIGVTRMQSARICFPAIFCLGVRAESIIAATIWVMEFEHLTTLKIMDLDAIEAKILEASMIYKGIERLCRDPTPI